MTIWKKAGLIVLIVAFAAGIFFFYHYFQTWPLRFHKELDSFFGNGNWKHISTETEESILYTVSYRSSYEGTYKERPGRFHNWDILFTNRNGEQEVWSISDHTMKINHDDNWFLSPKRYSARQALTLELMDISFAAASDAIQNDIIRTILPQQEADCLEVDISYRNGNPSPDVYDRLRKEPWFQANTVTAAHYLETDLYDFYIRIFAHDYKVEKLPEEQQEHLRNSLSDLEQALQNAYQETADYEIYLGEGYSAKYPGESY